MKKIQNYLLIVFISIVSVSFSQRGKDGNGTINTANRIVNEYTVLTADASIGAVSLSVSASGLNANGRFTASLSPGDLIMVIQMQGAVILGHSDTATPTISNPNDAAWGSVTNYNNCGKYELCQVAAVPNSTSISIDCGLINDYTASGKVQIVRVPRYNALTISNPGVLTCQSWNGTTGGVLAVEVKGNAIINSGGKISASGKGFRGAALFTPSSPRSQIVWYSCTSIEVAANKGEGIAGYDNDYTVYGGKFCRGAAANAGGGGNIWNAGGGGGANAGSIPSWTGQGNPDTTLPGWITAWNLESPGFAYSSSSGGGRGGYTFSGSNQNALVVPPYNLTWGGYARMNIGGLGGRPLDYSGGRIFMGGGGGGGEQDNNEGGAGGAGGGIIYFTSYGAITGGGTDSIISDGSHGGNSFVTPPISSYSGRDGSGGGGGGGTILLNTSGQNGIVLSAKGGRGGNQILSRGSLYFGAMNEAEGPGGGGGGGYIALSSGTAVQTASGGSCGTTNSDGLTEFIPNGATKGDAGLINRAIARIDTISAMANAAICSGDSVSLTASIVGAIPGVLIWYDAPAGGTVIGTDTLSTHALSAAATYYAGLCPGTYRIPVVVTVLPSIASVTITSNPAGAVCPGTPITFVAAQTNGGTAPLYHWLVNGNTAGTNAAVFVSTSLVNNDTVTCILTPNSGCASGVSVMSNAIVISITPSTSASITIASVPSGAVCAGTSVTFTAVPVNGGSAPAYQWMLNGINTGSNSAIYSSSSLNNGDVLTCMLTSNAPCVFGSPTASNTITELVNPLPHPSFTSNTNSGCSPLCIQFAESNGTNCSSVEYHFGDGVSAVTSSPQHCYTQTGIYSVSISCTDANNCTGTSINNNMITLVPKPIANFSVSPSDIVIANTNVSFTDASANSNSSLWNFGDPSSGGNNVSSLPAPSHIYIAAGAYCIKLYVQNLVGCTDSVNNCITVTNDVSIVIPNVFTPNGDGKNDLFFITTTAVKDLDCIIYDRWGIKITEWNTLNGGWDGRTKSGKMAQDGVYFYVVKAAAMNGEAIKKQGFLQLVKDN